MPRLRPVESAVAMTFDGERVVAERGEPVAVALVAAGHLALARSAKFHRPRGPSCLRAACDGCLARVNDVPNAMTCRIPAEEGMRIETQNVVGSRETDLLRMTDWFFPEGMNHHELFAGVPGVQRVMQAFARRVAGLGKLPAVTGERPAARAERREADVLVVGSGPSGMAVAVELSKKGRSVEVIDDALEWGGNTRALSAGGDWSAITAAWEQARAEGTIAIRERTTAAGVYGDDVLVATEEGVQVVTARTLVLAPGAHDGALAFEGNDVPGVMSARAAAWMLARGVAPGDKVVIAAVEGGGPFGAAVAKAYGAAATVVRGEPIVRVRGSARVKEVRFVERAIECDALLVDAPSAPAYEICAQAGAELSHEPRGFVVKADGGKVREGVFAAGEVVGTPLDAAAIASEAASIAKRA